MDLNRTLFVWLVCSVTAAAEPAPLFFQDFSNGNQVANFDGRGKHKFDFIGTTGDPGNYVEEIVDGDLILRTLPSPAGGVGGQGFLRSTPISKDTDALRFEFELALNNKAGPPNTFAALEFGDALPALLQSNSQVLLTRFLKIDFRKSTKKTLVLNNRTADSEYPVDLGAAALSGAMVEYQIILNDSPQVIDYAGPGKLGVQRISPGRMSLFYDLGEGWVAGLNEVPAMNGEKANLTQFRFVRVRIDTADAPDSSAQDPSLAAWRSLKITPLRTD